MSYVKGGFGCGHAIYGGRLWRGGHDAARQRVGEPENDVLDGFGTVEVRAIAARTPPTVLQERAGSPRYKSGLLVRVENLHLGIEM